MMERDEGRRGRHEAAEPVADEDAAEDGRPPRESRDPDHAGHGLGHGVVGSAPLGERSPLAETRIRDIDEARVDLLQPAVADAPRVERARAEVLHHDVGPAGELAEERLALLGVQIDADVVLRVVLGEESHRRVLPVGALGRDEAHGVAARRQLDLDDLGPQLAEEVGRRGAEHECGQLEHADTAQRLRFVEDLGVVKELAGPLKVIHHASLSVRLAPGGRLLLARRKLSI